MMIEVTNDMIHAAVKQAVKDKILPKYTDQANYVKNFDIVGRMLKQALQVIN